MESSIGKYDGRVNPHTATRPFNLPYLDMNYVGRERVRMPESKSITFLEVGCGYGAPAIAMRRALEARGYSVTLIGTTAEKNSQHHGLLGNV